MEIHVILLILSVLLLVLYHDMSITLVLILVSYYYKVLSY